MNPFKKLTFLCLCLLALQASAQTNLVVVHSFGVLTNVTGFNPYRRPTQGPDGTLYGVTPAGEGSTLGTVFKIQPDGSGFTVLKCFTNTLEGNGPSSSLVLVGSSLYGTTSMGGPTTNGTLFRINTDGTGFTNFYSFKGGTDGTYPNGGLLLSGVTLYATTGGGGTGNSGTAYKINLDGSGYTKLYNFANGTDGGTPAGSLVLSGSTLYGVCPFSFSAGNGNNGCVYKLGTNGTGFTTLHLMNQNGLDGCVPYAGLAISGTTLYGAATQHGSHTNGTLFKLNIDGSGFSVIYNFSLRQGNPDNGPNNDGVAPEDLIISGSTLYGCTQSGGHSNNGVVFQVSTSGTGFTTIHDFTNYLQGSSIGSVSLFGSTLFGASQFGGVSGEGTWFKVNTDGSNFTNLTTFKFTDITAPSTDLTLDGNTLYGTAQAGKFGVYSLGSYGGIFKVNTDGTGATNLYYFTNGIDGANPLGSVIISGTTLYGTAASGGANASGTVFKVNSDGTGFTTLHSFVGATEGSNPYGGLVLSGSTLYGTTSYGGSSSAGTIFKVNTNGTGYTTLYTFTGGNDGAGSYGGLVLSGSTLFGTAEGGGPAGTGTIFKIGTNGSGFTVLFSFPAANADAFGNYTNAFGAYPGTTLTLSGSTLYGTAIDGGKYGLGTIFSLSTNGTSITNLHSFTGGIDGYGPFSDLNLSGGALYGTAQYGGQYGNGNVFKVNTNGTGFSVLYNFTFGADGASPLGGVTFSGSVIYGAATYGGIVGDGTVYSLGSSTSTAATVTLGNLAQVYDGIAKTVSVSTAPTNLTVSVTYNGSANPPTNAGSYTVIGTITSANYFGSATNTLVISPATATVTLGNLAQAYDGTAKSVSVLTAPTNLVVNVTYNGSATSPTNVGSYTVIGTISNPNYTGSATNTLVINPGSATVNLGNLAQVYDGTAKSASVTTAPTNLTVTVTYSGSANPPTNAGSYTVIGTVTSANYSGSTTNTLIINPATATVTLGNLAQAYDGTARTVSVLTTPTNLVVNLTFNGSATSPTNPGSYIVIGTISNPNYTGSATNTLVINPGSATVTLGNLAQVYDGTAKSASVTTFPTNLTVVVTYNGSANPPTNAGSYTVVGTITSANYSGSSTNPLVIAKAPQTITFGSLPDAVYADAPFTLTATASSGLTVSYASSVPSVASVSNNTVFVLTVGSTILTASQAGNANYLAATNVSQTLVVEPPLMGLNIKLGPLTNRVASTAILQVTGNSNRLYTIIYNTDITVPLTNWPVLLATNLPGTNAQVIVPLDQVYRFYRLEHSAWVP